ncbi:restriction endonuclease subunit S [Flavobacterium sp. UMI-01]|uniref:restriction endonuclease subunit S n=1 Tax=Flavobacterium sp. UMI-01 TaxID=1441053 RepID=UPI00208C63A8|nr:restriction endonuclease subunit S [Flavobacterium sp. UMI-01]GIZ09803.1 hypothetical protein FUMI01_25300 [Flavobacterium sp. UMI-01]
MNWITKKIGDIGKVSMCKRILKNQTSATGDIPFYKIGTFGKKADAFISREIYDEFISKYSFPKKGDILLSASGTIGRRVIYDGKPAYFQDSNIVWIDNDEKEVLNEYLYKFYGYCNWNPSKGATISRLYNDDLRNIIIYFPKSFQEQRAIVAKLDQAFTAIDQAKANIEKNIANAKELFQSKLNQIFSQKGEGWEEKKLGEISKINYGYTEKAVFENIGPKYLRITDLTEKGVNWESVPHCKISKDEIIKYELQKGDIVFARTGATTGKSYLFDDDVFSVFASYLIRLKVINKNEILPEFIYLFFQSGNYWKEINAGISGSAQGGFNASKLSDLKLSYPLDSNIQKKIVTDFDVVLSQTNLLITKYQHKLANLEELKKSILEKAFKGELV